MNPSVRTRPMGPGGKRRTLSAALVGAFLLVAQGCGTGGGESDSGCGGACTQQALTRADVQRIVAQAVTEARAAAGARGNGSVAATIAVTDRVGNVLGVYVMDGAATHTLISSGRARRTLASLEDLVTPAVVAAISKAGTAAYLSSQGNAFTTRTANQIVQENFNPGEIRRPGGPLFGVQFSQLPCGDLVTKFDEADPDDRTGPHRMPIGLSADPGGIPLFKDSSGADGTAGRVPVGGIGVEIGCPLLDGCGACKVFGDDSVDEPCAPDPADAADACGFRPESLYGLDPNINDFDTHLEEIIALAGARGFEPPSDRRGDRIAVLGKFLRFTDAAVGGTPTFGGCAELAAAGAFVPVAGYIGDTTCETIRPGVALGSAASGIFATTFRTSVDPSIPAAEDMDCEVLVDDSGANRFPPRDAPARGDGLELTEDEVATILKNALAMTQLSPEIDDNAPGKVTGETRAQIRRPLGSSARITFSVVDASGNILGVVRARDAPVFGIDVSLQKARTAGFFSGPDARFFLETMHGIPANDTLANLSIPATPDLVSRYVGRAVDFLTADGRFDGVPITEDEVLTGGVAFADRSGGNLSRPFFPDGINNNGPGPFSKPFDEWSPFSTGLQLDLVFLRVAASTCLNVALDSCAGTDRDGGDGLLLGNDFTNLANGFQIFPGSVPIYRGNVLVGAIGVSGDGVDQDDMLGFLAVHNAGLERGGAFGNAPRAIRADHISLRGSNLRFINCPPQPFTDSNDQGVCDGL